MSHVYIILHNIRSVHNVGSIFRTADAVGVSKVYLTGFTPTPVDRFGRTRKDMAKVSLGAEKTVPWEYCKRIDALLERLKKERVWRVAVEQAESSVDYRRVRTKKKTAFLFGNEVTGLSHAVLARVDSIVEIPMRGVKESLNVSVAVGIMLFSSCTS